MNSWGIILSVLFALIVIFILYEILGRLGWVERLIDYLARRGR